MFVEEKVLAWNRKKGRLTYCAHRVNKATGKMEKYESDIENAREQISSYIENRRKGRASREANETFRRMMNS